MLSFSSGPHRPELAQDLLGQGGQAPRDLPSGGQLLIREVGQPQGFLGLAGQLGAGLPVQPGKGQVAGPELLDEQGAHPLAGEAGGVQVVVGGGHQTQPLLVHQFVHHPVVFPLDLPGGGEELKIVQHQAHRPALPVQKPHQALHLGGAGAHVRAAEQFGLEGGQGLAGPAGGQRPQTGLDDHVREKGVHLVVGHVGGVAGGGGKELTVLAGGLQSELRAEKAVQKGGFARAPGPQEDDALAGVPQLFLQQAGLGLAARKGHRLGKIQAKDLITGHIGSFVFGERRGRFRAGRPVRPAERRCSWGPGQAGGTGRHPRARSPSPCTGCGRTGGASRWQSGSGYRCCP